MSSVELVFSTAELLEDILLHLPLSSILVSRRICSYFDQLVNSSPALQQTLCLHPGAGSKKWHANPLLRKPFLPFFAVPEGKCIRRDYSALKMLDWTNDATSREAFLRKEASWRHMSFISHAPSSLQIIRWRHGMIGSSQDIAHSEHTSMGVIYDIVHSFLVNNVVSSFDISFIQTRETGNVEITIHLDMIIQCDPDAGNDDIFFLRSKGEEVSVRTLEWKRARSEDLMWDQAELDVGAETDLCAERGGVEKREWKKWRGRREKAMKRGLGVEDVSDVSEVEDSAPRGD